MRNGRGKQNKLSVSSVLFFSGYVSVHIGGVPIGSEERSNLLTLYETFFFAASTKHASQLLHCHTGHFLLALRHQIEQDLAFYFWCSVIWQSTICIAAVG